MDGQPDTRKRGPSRPAGQARTFQIDDMIAADIQDPGNEESSGDGLDSLVTNPARAVPPPRKQVRIAPARTPGAGASAEALFPDSTEHVGFKIGADGSDAVIETAKKKFVRDADHRSFEELTRHIGDIVEKTRSDIRYKNVHLYAGFLGKSYADSILEQSLEKRIATTFKHHPILDTVLNRSKLSIFTKYLYKLTVDSYILYMQVLSRLYDLYKDASRNGIIAKSQRDGLRIHFTFMSDGGGNNDLRAGEFAHNPDEKKIFMAFQQVFKDDSWNQVNQDFASRFDAFREKFHGIIRESYNFDYKKANFKDNTPDQQIAVSEKWKEFVENKNLYTELTKHASTLKNIGVSREWKDLMMTIYGPAAPADEHSIIQSELNRALSEHPEYSRLFVLKAEYAAGIAKAVAHMTHVLQLQTVKCRRRPSVLSGFCSDPEWVFTIDNVQLITCILQYAAQSVSNYRQAAGGGSFVRVGWQQHSTTTASLQLNTLLSSPQIHTLLWMYSDKYTLSSKTQRPSSK